MQVIKCNFQSRFKSSMTSNLITPVMIKIASTVTLTDLSPTEA